MYRATPSSKLLALLFASGLLAAATRPGVSADPEEGVREKLSGQGMSIQARDRLTRGLGEPTSSAFQSALTIRMREEDRRRDAEGDEYRLFTPPSCGGAFTYNDWRGAEVQALELARLTGHLDWRVRAAVADVWKQMGQVAAGAVRQLIHMLDDPDRRVRKAAAEALGSVGRPAVGPLLGALRTGSPEARAEAAWAFHFLGNEGRESVPYLVEALGQGSGPLRARAAVALAKVSPRRLPRGALAQALGDRDSDVVLAGMHALESWGPTSADVAALKESFMAPPSEPRWWAARILADAGPRGVAVLKKALGHQEEVFRMEAARGLSRRGREAEAVLPVLARGLHSPHRECPGAALDALGGYRGTRAARSFAVTLLPQMRSTDPAVRRRVVRALGRLGSAASVAIPTAVELLADDERRGEAEALLGNLTGVMDPALLGLLRDRNPDLRWQVARNLATLPDPPPELLEYLVPYLKSPDPEERGMAWERLWLMREAARPVLPLLGKILHEEEDPTIRRWAVRVAGGVSEAGGEEGLGLLLAGLEDRDERVQAEAILGMRRLADRYREMEPHFGPSKGLSLLRAREEEILPLLRRIAITPGHRAQSEALRLMGSFPRRKSVPILIRALRAPNSESRRQAAEALAELGSLGKDAVPELVARLQDPEPIVVRAAVVALGRVDPAAARAEAVPRLAQLLEGAEESYAALWLRTASDLGSLAEAVLPVVVEKGGSLDPFTRRAAVEAIGEIGERTQEAWSVVEHALEAHHPELRLQAAVAAYRLDRREAGRLMGVISTTPVDWSLTGRLADRVLLALAEIGEDVPEARELLATLSSPAGPEGLRERAGHLLSRMEEHPGRGSAP